MLEPILAAAFILLAICGFTYRMFQLVGNGAARSRSAVIELPRDVDATRELVFDGLLASVGTRSTKRSTTKRRFRVLSHIPGYLAGSQTYAFTLEPLEDQRTRLVVTTQLSGKTTPDKEQIEAGFAQLDVFAGWLASHGQGRVLAVGWGKP